MHRVVRALAVLLALAAATLCTARAIRALVRPIEPPPRSPRPPPSAWRAPTPDPTDRPEPGILDLPYAGRVGTDFDDGLRRDTVNLERTPTVYLKGDRFVLAGERRTAEIARLAERVRTLANRTAGGRFLFRADLTGRWDDALTTLRTILAAPASWIDLAVARDGLPGDPAGRIEWRPDASPSSESESTGPEIHVAIRHARAPDAGHVVSVGSHELRFADADPAKDGPVSPDDEPVWSAVRAALGPSTGHARRAVLHVEPDVPWGGVARVLGLLLAADVVRLEVTGLGTFLVSTPEEGRAWTRPDTRDSIGPWWFALGGVVLAGLVGWSANRSRPRRRATTR